MKKDFAAKGELGHINEVNPAFHTLSINYTVLSGQRAPVLCIANIHSILLNK